MYLAVTKTMWGAGSRPGRPRTTAGVPDIQPPTRVHLANKPLSVTQLLSFPLVEAIRIAAMPALALCVMHIREWCLRGQWKAIAPLSIDMFEELG